MSHSFATKSLAKRPPPPLPPRPRQYWFDGYNRYYVVFSVPKISEVQNHLDALQHWITTLAGHDAEIKRTHDEFILGLNGNLYACAVIEIHPHSQNSTAIHHVLKHIFAELHCREGEEEVIHQYIRELKQSEPISHATNFFDKTTQQSRKLSDLELALNDNNRHKAAKIIRQLKQKDHKYKEKYKELVRDAIHYATAQPTEQKYALLRLLVKSGIPEESVSALLPTPNSAPTLTPTPMKTMT